MALSVRDLLADCVYRRAKVAFATLADCVRRRSLRRPKAEEEGFEPPRPFWGLMVFKTIAMNRSATPPEKNGLQCKNPCVAYCTRIVLKNQAYY